MVANLALDDKLVRQAQKLGGHRTAEAAVTAALEEYVQRRRQLGLRELFGTVEYDRSYDYKKSRSV